MPVERNDLAPKLIRSIAAPSVLIVTSLGLLIWSSIFNQTARQVPMLVAGAMLVLSIFDFVCRFDRSALQPLRDFRGADFGNREMPSMNACESFSTISGGMPGGPPMMRFDYPRLTLVIALVLGETCERSYHLMMISDNHMLQFILGGRRRRSSWLQPSSPCACRSPAK